MYYSDTDFYAQLASISHISHSPCGNYAFIKSIPHDNGKSYRHYLYIGHSTTCRSVLEMKTPPMYLWKNDTHIIYRGESFPDTSQAYSRGTYFYDYDVTAGSSENAFFLPLPVKKLLFANEKYYFIAICDLRCPDIYKADEPTLRSVSQAMEYEDQNYQIIDELPFYYNEKGFVNKQRDALFSYDPQTKTIHKISNLYENVSDFAAVNEALYFSAKTYDCKMPSKERLFRYIESCGQRTVVTQDTEYYFSGMCEFCGSLAFFAAEGRKYHYWESPKLYITDKTGDSYRPVFSPDRHPANKLHLDTAFFGGKTLEAKNDTLYFLLTDHSSCGIFSYNPTNGPRQIINKPGGVLCFSVSPVSGNILLSGLWNGIPNELYQISQTEQTEEKLTSYNHAYLAGRTLYKPERIPFHFRDHETDAWMIKPQGWERGRSFPGILYIHGGPLLAFSEAHLHEMQILSEAGFFVFFCNPRGSDGRGDEFSDIRGKFGKDDYEELMSFTDLVLDSFPEIDRKQLCVTGGSYAGFMVNWIIGHTDRFCCAVSQRSISNWISFYGDTDIGTIYAPEHIGATPFENADKLWDHSPMKYAGNVQTPTLFLHADEDGCAPLSEALQMYTSLADRGIDTRLVIFKGENHNLSRNGRPHHKCKRMREMLLWFQKYTGSTS